MVTDINIAGAPKKQLSINPKRFILWLFMVSIVMVFASLTSGFIVRQSEGNWLNYELPSQLLISTIILVLSSVSVQWAVSAAKKKELSKTRFGLSITLLLGTIFLISQVWVWSILVQEQVYFVGNPGGSFLYVLMGVHAFHLISGLIYLLIMLVRTFKEDKASKLQFQLGMSATYWHFLDGLWIYLYVFLIIYH
ncbi:MAG: cytochrome c oxidase subunit 3 [Cyclobacteriaceae bacterium]|nr:cytochrome c oxidase subunit 3 [Cyclobacteriaceae bacterium]